MNKLLHLLFLDLKLLSKTKVFYFKLILFPCVLILILGSMFSGSSSKLTTFNVAFYSEDTDTNENLSLGNTLKDDVLESDDIKSIFTLNGVSSYSEGEKLVNDKKVSAFIYVPKDFTKSYIENTESNIELLADNSKQLDKDIVKNILNSFDKKLETVRTEESEVENNLASNPNMGKIESIFSKIQDTTDYTTDIDKVSTNKMSKPIDIMQYESIAMIVMFSILTAFELAHNIVDDKLNNTQFRIKSTPTLDIQYALEKVTGIVLAITVQMLIVMSISHLIFKVDFGNVFYILLTTFSYGFTIGAIVFCVGTLAKDHMSISSFASIILYGFSFLGGSFMNKDSFPDTLQLIQKIIPNGKAINCYLKICQGGGLLDIYKDLIALIIIGSAFLIFSLFLYSERRSNNADINNDKKSIKAAL